MRISVFDAEVLPAEFWQTAELLRTARDLNFVAQAKLVGLDPARAFRYSDLMGIDFSHCDLRGFDFTGANLRGCYGVEAVWDDSTILSKADARGSLFEYEISKREHFRERPDDNEFVKRLAGEIWTNTILGVESLLRSRSEDASALKIVQAVFDETKSTVVRSNILAFMRLSTGSASDHKAFIFNTFARFSKEPAVVIAGIRTLGAFYRDDVVVFSWLKCFLQSNDPNLRREAFKALISSRHFLRGVAALREYAINSNDSLTRRVFLGRLAKIAGPSYVRATTDTDVTNYIDFATPITRRKLEDMAHRTLQVERLRSREDTTSHNATETGRVVRIREGETRELAKDFKRYLSALGKQYKIPFLFDL